MEKSKFFNLFKNSKNEENKKAVPIVNEERISLSVVADEFHKLTENSREQSKAIKTVLSSMKESINKIKKSSEELLDRFDTIDSGVGTITRQE